MAVNGRHFAPGKPTTQVIRICVLTVVFSQSLLINLLLPSLVLCGQLLCFFKEQEDFAESRAAASPLNLYQAQCERASDYTKRKNVFRLRTSDGAEFLFSAEDPRVLDDWVKKISFHASLSPAQQLMSYDSYQVRSVAQYICRPS